MWAGALYSLWRNPQGCACCGCFALVLALILGVLVIGLVMSAWQFIVVIVVVIVSLKALQPTIETWIREWMEQRRGR
jgi:MFS family permease